MKTVCRALALLVILSLNLPAAEIRAGQNLSDVGATMGPPRGQVKFGDRQLLYYDRGEIELQAGAVSRVALLSPDDFAVLEAKRAAIVMRVREEQATRRAQVSAEGEKALAHRLADTVFQAAPLAYQVAFWEDFSRRYPEVSCVEPLTIARLRYAEQLEVKRTQADQEMRLADLEIRTREAEARADASSRRIRNYRYADGASSQPFSMWPIEYRYFDVIHSAAASPGVFNQQPIYRADSSPPPLNFDVIQKNHRSLLEANDLGRCEPPQVRHDHQRRDGRF